MTTNARDHALICGALLGLLATPAVAETCWTGREGQYFNSIQYCVSSVLAPQAGNTYGPDHLADWDTDARAAWCEGAKGHGIGETITIRVKGGPAFRRLLVGNGYNKSPQTYASNGRVKTVEITADTGMSAVVNLADRSDLTPVDLPAPAHDWIRVKILDAYPGEKFADTCVSFLMPDLEHEEELLQKDQGLLPPQPEGTSGASGPPR